MHFVFSSPFTVYFSGYLIQNESNFGDRSQEIIYRTFRGHSFCVVLSCASSLQQLVSANSARVGELVTRKRLRLVVLVVGCVLCLPSGTKKLNKRSEKVLYAPHSRFVQVRTPSSLATVCKEVTVPKSSSVYANPYTPEYEIPSLLLYKL